MKNNPVPEPQRESYLKYKHDLRWKIIFPLVLATLLVIALSALAGVAAFSGGDYARWAAISTIWMLVPLLAFGVIGFVLLVGLVYAFARLLNIAPHYTGRAQTWLLKANARVQIGAQNFTSPIIKLKSLASVLARRKK